MCCKKREVYLNTIQQFTMALSCVMTSSVIFLKRSHVKDFMHRYHVEICLTHWINNKINFRFGQKVKVKLGSPFFDNWRSVQWCKDFKFTFWLLRYNFFMNIKLWLPVWTGSKGQIGVTFLYFFLQITICTMMQKLWIYLLRLLR